MNQYAPANSQKLILDLSVLLAPTLTIDDFKRHYIDDFNKVIRALISHYDIPIDVTDAEIETCALRYSPENNCKIADTIPSLSAWKTQDGQTWHKASGRNIDDLFEVVFLGKGEYFCSNEALSEHWEIVADTFSMALEEYYFLNQVIPNFNMAANLAFNASSPDDVPNHGLELIVINSDQTSQTQTLPDFCIQRILVPGFKFKEMQYIRMPELMKVSRQEDTMVITGSEEFARTQDTEGRHVV